MLVRILQSLLGALLGGGGGYLVWMNRDGLVGVFPPGPGGVPWLLVVGVLGLSAGIVFLVSAVHPRPNRRRELAARAEKRAAQLGEAEAYYAEAGRAADRDWRSGDITPPVVPQAPAPQSPAPQGPVPQAVDLTPPVQPVPPAPPATPPAAATPAPQAQPVKAVAPAALPAAAPPPVQAVAVPAAAVQPVAPPAPPPSTTFPSTASLAPILAASESPPAIVANAPAATPALADAHAPIREAIKAGRLEEAERLLEAGRETAQGLALAELTGLAGDHAAAAGRQSHAKWLWRLALRRFGEAGAMDAPAARAVSESLRVSG